MEQYAVSERTREEADSLCLGRKEIRPFASTLRSGVRGLKTLAQIHRRNALGRLGFDILVEAVAVGVDRDDERAEVLDAEFPQALGHEIFPPDLLDFFDLQRFQRRRASDDCEIN